MATATRPADERLRSSGVLRKLLNRPELGAVAGAILVFAFFAIVAGDSGFLTSVGAISYLEVSAQLGIIVIPVAMLMIAGEFDLSVGSMIGAAGILIALPTAEYGWPLWAALLLAFAVALLVGFINGYLVVTTGLPSFIVTLASLFALRGATIGFTRLITGRTQVSGVQSDGFFAGIFGGEVAGVPVSIFWWVGLGILGTWILLRTTFGNWIFGTGGDPVAARNVGVPVRRVKILLFMATACSATLLAAITVLDAGSADVLRGTLREFQAIIATVIGGVLLTGGYGSVIGPMFGALIFGMVSQGIFFTGVNTDWFQVFLGAMLLIAVLVNNYIRKKASEAR
ncbi:MAG TPA: ABC transporter permease [Rubrobacteraceae bacterium]|nr:ABC transporter permease [Rubrobacteraceae bacterium]